LRQDAEKRRLYGQSRRRILKRSEQSVWDPSRRSHDPVEVILSANKDRLSGLLPIKMARMAASPFGFFRGSVPLMAVDLALLPATGIEVQICGDAHVRNLGAFAAPDGRLVFDINDFDETIRAPWEWDVKRMSASLVLAGREAGNAERLCKESVLEFARSYRGLMLQFSSMAAVEVARYRIHRPFEGAAGLAVLRKAERATPLHSLERMTRTAAGGKRVFRTIKPVLTHPSRHTVKQVLRSLGSYRETLPPERQHVLDFYRPEDVAFKIVGTGSVGTRDYIVLCFGNGIADPLFLQIKEEPPSGYTPYVKSHPAKHQGERVVFGQRRMQTHSDILLGWTSIAGRDYLVRQLADHKGCIEDADLKDVGLIQYARTCGEVLAKGHARSGDACALAGYLGERNIFDQAIAKFAASYADQTVKDYQCFKRAIRRGRVKIARSTYL